MDLLGCLQQIVRESYGIQNTGSQRILKIEDTEPYLLKRTAQQFEQMPIQQHSFKMMPIQMSVNHDLFMYSKSTFPVKWSQFEEETLAKLVKQNNLTWKEIAEQLAKITNSAIRPVNAVNQHWTRVSNPEIQKGRWAPEEDQLLLTAIQKSQPRKWTDIAKLIPGRSDIQIRYRILKKYDWFSQRLSAEYLPERE
ncbi:Myb-like_DNA-binding domain-containing protein [Hexamita inflata]|uniref:Myb-like DNA-binding domain-containing protein n=1 Tax=Hexamita inflata TaxID=28002 RepID=A0AA86V429_9EUKA|nr:Myb-like DNA-binding domain-containing protein [Hexamita inflata]